MGSRIKITLYKVEAAERFETWGEGGGSSYTEPSAYPYSNFPKCPLPSLLAQANLFAILKCPVWPYLSICDNA